MPTRPLLAAKIVDPSTLTYPLLATPKIDGIRCLKLTTPLTRTFKPIPNVHIASKLQSLDFSGLDGELVVPDADFNTTQSAVMSRDGEPDFHYLVFDCVPEGMEWMPHVERWTTLEMAVTVHPLPAWVKLVRATTIHSQHDLELYEKLCLEAGYEGVCLRAPYAPYKSGRSTLREQYLLKLKRFLDAEAVVYDFVPLLHNQNPQAVNELGMLKRSHKQEHKLVSSTLLGALRCRTLAGDIEFEVGSGFTLAQRAEIWANQDAYRNRIITYKYQPHGMKERPRCPVFKSFRLDMELPL